MTSYVDLVRQDTYRKNGGKAEWPSLLDWLSAQCRGGNFEALDILASFLSPIQYNHKFEPSSVSMSSISDSLYKVAFDEEDVGRVRKESKKRITWTFQLAPSPAEPVIPESRELCLLDAPDETPAPQPTPAPIEPKMYSVTLVWSVNTGKQQVEFNGEEIFFGRKQGSSVFSHAFTTRDNLRLEVLATCRPPKRHVAPDFRAYDLMINGHLFHSLPALNVEAFANSETGASSIDLPRSIIEVLYPNGYTWEDPRTGMKMPSDYKGQGIVYDEDDEDYQIQPADQ